MTLYADVKVGARTTIHSGAVIGADGFGYTPKLFLDVTDRGHFNISHLAISIGDAGHGLEEQMLFNINILRFDRVFVFAAKISNAAFFYTAVSQIFQTATYKLIYTPSTISFSASLNYVTALHR